MNPDHDTWVLEQKALLVFTQGYKWKMNLFVLDYVRVTKDLWKSLKRVLF